MEDLARWDGFQAGLMILGAELADQGL